MRRATRPLAPLVGLLLAAAALAHDWTIQTVAVRDLREAQAIAADLLRLRFDAYTEFTMANGRQYVRVRVGCFASREDAEAVAELLRGRATREAVVIERMPGAPARGCVVRDVGFVAPDGYRQRAPGVASFEVEVAGVAGLVRYRGGRWQVLQAPAAEALSTRVGAGRSFRQAEGVPEAFVTFAHADGPLLACAGRLLAEVDGAAIVERSGVVSACRFGPPTPEATP